MASVTLTAGPRRSKFVGITHVLGRYSFRESRVCARTATVKCLWVAGRQGKRGLGGATGRRATPGKVVSVSYEVTRTRYVRLLRWTLLRRPVIKLGDRDGLGPDWWRAAPGVRQRNWCCRPRSGDLDGANVRTCSTSAPPRRAWRKFMADGESRQVEFTEEGVRVRTERSDSFNQWLVYSETLETASMYLLRRGKYRAYLIIFLQAGLCAHRGRKGSSAAWPSCTLERICERQADGKSLV